MVGSVLGRNEIWKSISVRYQEVIDSDLLLTLFLCDKVSVLRHLFGIINVEDAPMKTQKNIRKLYMHNIVSSFLKSGSYYADSA